MKPCRPVTRYEPRTLSSDRICSAAAVAGGRHGSLLRRSGTGPRCRPNGIFPFTAGTARPVSAYPCGTDLLTGTAVAFDHEAFYMEDVISSPSMILFGINDMGKCLDRADDRPREMSRGMIPAVFNPLKQSEHTPLVEQAGGAMFEFGPNARHQLNLLSPGPLGRAAERIGGTVGRELRELGSWKVTKQAQFALGCQPRLPCSDDMEDCGGGGHCGDRPRARNPTPVTGDLCRRVRAPRSTFCRLHR